MKSRIQRLNQIFRPPAPQQSKKAGLPPGTVVYVGADRTGVPNLSLYAYKGDGELHITDGLTLSEGLSMPDEQELHWYNLDGVHRESDVQELGKFFHLHPLTQEDIANTELRPKAEEFDNYLFVLLKMISYEPEKEHIHIEQVSLVLTQNTVLTFQEDTADVFDSLRKRLEVKGSRLRKAGADYLFFALIDVIISHYFQVLEQLEGRLAQLESDIIEYINQDALTEMQRLRQSLQMLQRAILPLREVILYCMRSDSMLLQSQTRVYFQELSDQINQATDTVNSHQDSVNNLQSLYLALASQKTNDVMKVLTIISTIFLPLSFLAGVYGMNFEYMPELKWHEGYFVFWGVMLALIVGMLAYFRRKGWI